MTTEELVADFVDFFFDWWIDGDGSALLVRADPGSIVVEFTDDNETEHITGKFRLRVEEVTE